MGKKFRGRAERRVWPGPGVPGPYQANVDSPLLDGRLATIYCKAKVPLTVVNEVG